MFFTRGNFYKPFPRKGGEHLKKYTVCADIFGGILGERVTQSCASILNIFYNSGQ